jgi:hypothetical protein
VFVLCCCSFAGHGLSYSRFSYARVHASSELGVFTPCQHITVKVTVSLVIGGATTAEADEVLQLYVANHNASVPTPKHQLVSFSRLTLMGGQTPVSFTILPEDHAVLRDPDFAQTVEPGEPAQPTLG